jgi:hypothetical protein
MNKAKTYKSPLFEEILNNISEVEAKKIETKMLLAAKIADAMQKKGWNKTDLLKAVGKSNPSIVTKWLSGTHNFTSDTLVEIGVALGINLMHLEEKAIFTDGVQYKIELSMVAEPKINYADSFSKKTPRSEDLHTSLFNKYKAVARA